MRKSDGRRSVLRTVLLVGEGYAEVAFIEHLKALYVSRGCGISLTVKNARGKVALYVVEVEILQSKNADFDVKAAFLDTDIDTGWGDKTRSTARKAKVQIVPCIPCLEAMLLALRGDVQEGLSTAYYKRSFENKFGKPADVASLYGVHFSKDFLDNARIKSPQLESLLALLTRTPK